SGPTTPTPPRFSRAARASRCSASSSVSSLRPLLPRPESNIGIGIWALVRGAARAAGAALGVRRYDSLGATGRSRAERDAGGFPDRSGARAARLAFDAVVVAPRG